MLSKQARHARVCVLTACPRARAPMFFYCFFYYFILCFFYFVVSVCVLVLRACFSPRVCTCLRCACVLSELCMPACVCAEYPRARSLISFYYFLFFYFDCCVLVLFSFLFRCECLCASCACVILVRVRVYACVRVLSVLCMPACVMTVRVRARQCSFIIFVFVLFCFRFILL